MKQIGMAVYASALLLCFQSPAQNVVTQWNSIASTTIVKNGRKASVASGVWFAYTSIAVYDAVNAIHREFEPFCYRRAAPREASDEAAAVAAAHRVLVHYFPAQQPQLDQAFTASLNAISKPARAKAEGVATGEAAADALIRERSGDGLEASVPYSPGSGPGVWQPTPPAFAQALTPWLGQMRPFTLKSPDEFLPHGPTPLAGEQWIAEYNLTKQLGEAQSTSRTAGQTEIGVFWTEHTGQQYSRAFSYLAEKYKLNVLDSARLMAVLWTGYADAGIGCWNAKFNYNFWRPVTAIREGGANAELSADPSWTPLAATPAHPEYPAAHGCVTGALTALVDGFFGTHQIRVLVDSTAFPDGVHKHTFDSTDDWLGGVYWARIFAGFHFHRSLEDGVALGRQVAARVLHSYRRCERRHDDWNALDEAFATQ